MSGYINYSYNALNEIYREKAYCSIVLSELLPKLPNEDKAAVTRIVYGVIEHHEEFSYMMDLLCKKTPKAVIRVVLRLGMYLIKYMDSIPDYAAVNEVVELTKTIGKKDLAAFVNGFLKKYINAKNSLPEGLPRMAIDNNIPLWLAKRYIEDYGESEGMEIIQSKSSKLTHIRANVKYLNIDGLENILKERNIQYSPTEYGFLIGATDKISDLIEKGEVTVQALCSMYVCHALTPKPVKGKILDVCSAPGGKAVYLSELNPEASILALDVYPHRVGLIESYAKRMGAKNITSEVMDGTYVNTDWLNNFDKILADVPCSGFGVRGTNPDIIINKKESDIASLQELQYKILSVASSYLKVGGTIIYSTCSDVKAENEDVVTRFLAENSNFALKEIELREASNGMYRYICDEVGHEGFFIACMERLL